MLLVWKVADGSNWDIRVPDGYYNAVSMRSAGRAITVKLTTRPPIRARA